MHDINFFSQLQSARRLSAKSWITLLTILAVIALNVTAVMFLNSILLDKQLQLAQLNEHNNSAQSIQLLADSAAEGEENRVKQAYYAAAATLTEDIKKADMLPASRLDDVIDAIPAQVSPSTFSYSSGTLTFECISPSDAAFLPLTIKALEDTGHFLSVSSEGVSFVDPAQSDAGIPEGEPAQPYCTFTISCLLKEGGK